MLSATALLLASTLPAVSAELPKTTNLDFDNPVALREANRILEEELKLAGRPQPYLILDLPTQTILIKSRALELHRLPVAISRTADGLKLTGFFRLSTRPAIVRRKASPSDNADQEPISLDDMPVTYHLHFTPPLTIRIAPPMRDNPWQWLMAAGADWWTWLREQAMAVVTRDRTAAPPTIRLTLGTEQAQSLAWSVTEGMPLLVRRTTDTE